MSSDDENEEVVAEGDEQPIPVIGPIAKIPWMSWKTSNIKLEDHPYFKDVMTAGEEGSRRLELYRILNQTFPFYLPKRFAFIDNLLRISSINDRFRFHTMDGWSLHAESKEGQYWATASFFLFCSQAHDCTYHTYLGAELSNPNPNLSPYGPAYCPNLKSHFFEVCYA
jgi:hypothetical protein